MKYLYAIIFSFIITSPVYAVKQPVGDVPDVKPLQPPAVGVNPNYSKNIQYVDPTRATSTSVQKAPEQIPSPIQQDLVNQHKSYPWGLIITLLLGFGALYLVWRNTRKP
jgi:hypothetical protein